MSSKKARQAPDPAKEKRLAELLATPPPRVVPRELRLPVPTWGVLLSLVFILGTSGLAWVFFPWGFWQDLRLSASAIQAPGHVVSLRNTGQNEGQRHGPGYPIYEYDFVFTPVGGAPVQGESYATHYSISSSGWKAGSRVTIEYLPSHPAVARIATTRTTLYGMSNVGFVLMPVVTTGLFIAVWMVRRRVIWFFKRGELAEARVVAVEPTGKIKRLNSLPIYKITLLRTDNPDAPPWIMREWQEDTVKLAQERCAAKRPVSVLHDPQNPKRLLLPEAWADW